MECVYGQLQAVPGPEAVMSPMRPNHRHHRWSADEETLLYIRIIIIIIVVIVIIIIIAIIV